MDFFLNQNCKLNAIFVALNKYLIYKELKALLLNPPIKD
jgi:hypothetical protein